MVALRCWETFASIVLVSSAAADAAIYPTARLLRHLGRAHMSTGEISISGNFDLGVTAGDGG